jgi:hypothetical protein
MICSVLNFNHHLRHFPYTEEAAVDPIYRIFSLPSDVIEVCQTHAFTPHMQTMLLSNLSHHSSAHILFISNNTPPALYTISLFSTTPANLSPVLEKKTFSRGSEFRPYNMDIKSRTLIQFYAGDQFCIYINL